MKLANRAKMTTNTTGTGNITLGVASIGYQTFENAGVIDNDEVRYVIEDGVNWEIGTGIYNGGVISRSLTESSTGTLLNMSGNATILLSITADDFATSEQMADIVTAFVESQTRYVDALGVV